MGGLVVRYASWCWTTQCGEMSGGSTFLSWLRTNAWNPQTSGGTDWTNLGSYADGTVSASSSVDMGASHMAGDRRSPV